MFVCLFVFCLFGWLVFGGGGDGGGFVFVTVGNSSAFPSLHLKNGGAGDEGGGSYFVSSVFRKVLQLSALLLVG